MENTKKKFGRYSIIATAVINTAFLIGLIVITQYLVFTPILEAIDYKATNTEEVFQIYPQASSGDQKALDRLEQLTHKDTSSAYTILGMIYRKDALKQAGVDMKDPNANFQSVDLSKSNELIMRAVEELRDLELLIVLRYSEEQYNDKKSDAILSGLTEKTLPTEIKNKIRFLTYSTLDQQMKDQLNDCRVKLEEKFKNEVKFLINFNSVGACTKNPPDGSISRSLDIYQNAKNVQQDIEFTKKTL